MVTNSAATVSQYLDDLPAERRPVVPAVRDVVRRNLPAGYREAMGWGMICYEIPLERYPKTYNDLPLEAIGRIVAAVPADDFIARYQASRKR